MILDHPLRKAFTIEEGALVAVDLLQYDTIKDSLAGIHSSITKNTKLSNQSYRHDFTEQINLAQEILSIFKQAYLDGMLIPYVNPHIDDLDIMLFCRKSLFSLLKSKDKDCNSDVSNKPFCKKSSISSLENKKYQRYNFNLDENKAYSFPTEYVSLVHDNQFKLGFTSSEIALMFYDIGSVQTIQEIQPHEYNSLRLSALSKDHIEIKTDEAFKLIVNKDSLLLIKSVLETEARRILQGLGCDLIIESVYLLPGSQSIDYNSLTFTRASIRQYLIKHQLQMQAELFTPYEKKLKKLAPKILSKLKLKKNLDRRNITIELAGSIWKWAHGKYLKKDKVTQSQCTQRYNIAKEKSNLTQKSYLGDRAFKTEISLIAEKNGFEFTQYEGLQKKRCCA
ncbi:MAG: hypothetical protein ACJAXJ_001756 [Colwellia sp.]|jgi:hypothetical protein